MLMHTRKGTTIVTQQEKVKKGNPATDEQFISKALLCSILSVVEKASLGSLRYGDYGLRTTAGRALSFVCSTGLSRANIER